MATSFRLLSVVIALVLYPLTVARNPPTAPGRYDPPMTERDQDLPDSIAANVAEWSETNAQYTDANAEQAWAPQDLAWGVFQVRE